MPFRTLLYGLLLTGLSLAWLGAQDTHLTPISHTIQLVEVISQEAVPRAAVRVFEGDSLVGQYLADSQGQVHLRVLPYRLWNLEVVSSQYYPEKANLDTRNLSQIDMPDRIALMPKGYFRFKGVLLDENLEYFLPGVAMKLYDRTTQRSYFTASNDRGVYYFPLVPGHDYEVWLIDKAYFRSRATLQDCSDQFKGDTGRGIFCTSGFSLQDDKYDVDTGLRTLVGTMRAKKVGYGQPEPVSGLSFAPGTSHIHPDAARVLDGLLVLFKQNPALQIEIGSHTAAEEPVEDHQQLSQSRAEAVRTFLINRGISAERIRAKGYGNMLAFRKSKIMYTIIEPRKNDYGNP